MATPSTIRHPAQQAGDVRRYAHLAETALWSAAVVVALLVALNSAPGSWRGVQLVSATALAFGLLVFWRDGGQNITATGVYGYASAIFVGMSGLYVSVRQTGYVGPGWYVVAASLALLVNVAVYAVVRHRRRSGSGANTQSLQDASPDASAGSATWAFVVGALALATGLALVAVGARRMPLTEPIAFSGVALMVVALLSPGHRTTLLRGAVAALLFGVYAQYVFVGFGRLALAAMGMCIAVAAAHRFRGRLVKLALLVSLPPGLVFLARSRVSFMATVNGDAPVADTGFESVVNPLEGFARLAQASFEGLLPHAGGSSFLAALTLPVPRSLWPEKPIGLGAELVPVLRPDLIGTEHSELALFYGEWVYNFGLLGLLLMIPVTALVLHALDDWLTRARSSGLRTRRSILSLTAATVAAAGVLDLFWGGTFTYMNRGGLRLTFLALLIVVLTATHRRATAPR